jgi:hypothetical protein
LGERRKKEIGAKERHRPGLRAERVPCARYTCEARDGMKRPLRRTRVISHASILFDAARPFVTDSIVRTSGR